MLEGIRGPDGNTVSAGFCISKLMTRLNCVNDTEGCFTSSPALACKSAILKVPGRYT